MNTTDREQAPDHNGRPEGAQDRLSNPQVGEIALSQAMVGLEALKPFVTYGQMRTLWDLCRQGEEKAYFKQKVMDLAATIKAMPKTYETDGQGLRAVAVLHYFTPALDYYITEKDREGDGTRQAFGLAMAPERELGYISIAQLVEAGAELDLHWVPKTLAEIGR